MEAAVKQQQPQEAPTIVASNAGRTAEQHACERMKALVAELNGGSRRVVTEARDRLDDLMHALDHRGTLLEHAIAEYAGFVQQSVEMAGIIMEPIEELAGDVTAGMAPSPGRQVTQKRA